MKNHRLPDKNEWDKIVDEAFSSDEVHTFSGEYNMKKYQNFQVRKGITMKKNNLLMNLTVVATALAVIAVPTGLYVANNMTTTKSNTQFTENEQASPLSDDTVYAVEFGWLPEDFNYNSEDSYTYFTNTGNEKIFMIASFTKNLSGEKTENGKGLTVRDEYQTDDKTVDIRYNNDYVENSEDKNCMNYGRVATIYFKDTPYELELLVTDDVTKDDFKKIIDNVKLVESDTETATIYNGEQAEEADTIYDVEYGWLPEDFEYNNEESYAYFTNAGNEKIFMITSFMKNLSGFTNANNEKIFMIASYMKILSGEETVKDSSFTLCDEYEINNKTVEIRYNDSYIENSADTDTKNYGRVATIYFKDTPYELELLVTDDVTKEDFAKIIENIRLVESDTERAEIYTGEQVQEEKSETLYDIEYGWIPDSLERIDGETYSHNFKNVNNDRQTILVSFNKNLTGEEAETDSAAPVRDTYETADKTIKVGYYDNYIENSTDTQHNKYGRQALVCFKDSPYELVIWVTDDVTKDDFRKFLENIKLVPTDTEKAWVYYPENVTKSEFTISDGKNDGKVNEGTKEFKESESKNAENYDDTIYDVEYGWLPEGLEYQPEDSPYGGKFHNFTKNSGMTPSFTKYPDGNKSPVIVNRCKDTENYTAEGKTVTISYRADYQENTDNYNYGRIADISFDNTPYSLSLWVTDDITKEDLKMIIANVKLVPSDKETAYIYNQQDEEILKEYRDVSDEIYSDVKVYHIGEDIDVDNYNSGYKCRLKINDISFDTAFGDINPDGALGKSSDLYNDFKGDILDNDGNLVDNVRKYVQYSDGNDVKYQETEETIPTHIMTVKMTYTNTGDTTIENISDSNNTFTLLTKRGDGLINTHMAKVIDHFGGDDTEKYDFYDTFDVLKKEDVNSFIYYVQDKNTLKPNESTEIKMAFVVEDEFMDNVYLDLAFCALPMGPVNEASHVVNVSISQKPE